MNINWVLANQTVLDPLVDLESIKTIGSTWGSWHTWRGCQTDNVICHNAEKAQELIQNSFHTLCNFYIPNFVYDTNRPTGVKSYIGEFDRYVANPEELVAMHLASTSSDLILLLGFNLTEPTDTERDRLGLTYSIIKNTPNVQWVLLDHEGTTWSEITKLPNFSQDSLHKALNMFLT
jgi:hypothetical protein